MPLKKLWTLLHNLQNKKTMRMNYEKIRKIHNSFTPKETMLRQKILPLSLAFALLSLSLFPPSATLAAELAEIQRRGKLIVAVKDNLRPLGFRDAEGNLQGLEIDIAKQLAYELLGDENAVILQPVSNAERLKVVYEGKVDLAIARVTVTESRSRLVDFSRYYYLDGTGFVTKDPSVQQLGDLEGKKIALLNEASTIPVVRYALPNASFVGVNSYQEGLDLLEAGEAVAFAADRSVLAGWVQEYPQYRQLPVRLSGEALGVVMPRGLQYASLRQRVNNAIALWKQSGWLQNAINVWGLPNS